MIKDINAITPEYMKHRLEEETEQYKQEIERLNKENKILRKNAEHNDKVVDKVNWENKRLSNIINELEHDFERKIQSCTIEVETTTNDFYCRLHIATLTKWLNKIKELKGESNE